MLSGYNLTMKKKVLIVLADGFEELEAVAPIDVLKRAGLEVTIAGLDKSNIESARGLKILTDSKLDDIKGEFDCLILPGGGEGAENLAKSLKLKSLIKDMYNRGKLIAAICASPVLVLSPTGILKGKKATCYPGVEKEFSPDVKFVNENIVVDGNIVTSRGPGTALLFGLKIVEILIGKETADSLKEKMVIN